MHASADKWWRLYHCCSPSETSFVTKESRNGVIITIEDGCKSSDTKKQALSQRKSDKGLLTC